MQTRSLDSRTQSNPIMTWLAGTLAIVLLLAPGAASARSLDEAVNELAVSLSDQLEDKHVTWVAILQFSSLPAKTHFPQGPEIADALAKKMNELGAVNVPKRVQAERVARRLGYPPGSYLDAENAGQLSRHVGGDAIMIGTIEDQGDGEQTLQVMVYSTGEGATLASARSSVVEKKVAD